MAARQSTAPRRSTAQPDAFHELGVAGRKTGVTLKDTGVRDEHGMQPLEDIFSSPEKESQNGFDEDDSSEDASMDIDETTAPAPSAFMNGTRLPPARARSPLKTNLQSPARRPLGMSSSPIRASNVASGSPSGAAKSVQRKLDFKNKLMANKPSLPQPNGVNKGKGKANAVTNGYRSSPEEEEEEEELPQQQEEESMAMLDGGAYPDEDEEEGPEEDLPVEEEPIEEQSSPPSAKKPKGRSKKTAAAEPKEPPIVASIEEDAEPAAEPLQAGKKRGRPAKSKAAAAADDEPVQKKAKKAPLVVEEEEGGSSDQPPTKKPRGRSKAAAIATEAAPQKPAIPKQKRGAKKQASPAVGDTSIAEVPRGPPLPKSRGLVITRRETPGASATFTTRSGRTSFQPLKFWRNERAELEDDAILEDGKNKIMLPKIKEIVRYEDPEPDVRAGKRRKGKAAARQPGRRRAFAEDDDDDDDLEEWEQEGDVISGEVVVWQPEHELNPPGPDEQIEVAADEQIAISANAIQTREIRNASFKFAKVLSTPFFGAGVVDLPPGSEKKPKNARKMQMAFFVFAGRVQVTVADTIFSIGRGGMWFVPRGNYYSIENQTTKPARIFFAQGCEVSSLGAGDMSQLA